MPSAPLIDIESLLQPIPGDVPSGVRVPGDIVDKLREKRIDDPEVERHSDWEGIVKLATQTLQETSKDLDLAVRLTEALVKFQEEQAASQNTPFAGVRDGLRLLRELAENCWDRLHPQIEDDDLEVRLLPFDWLDEVDRGAYFPPTVRSIPLLLSPHAYTTYRGN